MGYKIMKILTYTVKYAHYFRHTEPNRASPIVGIVNVGDKIDVLDTSPMNWFKTTDNNFISVRAFGFGRKCSGPHVVLKKGNWPVCIRPEKNAYIIDYIQGPASYPVLSRKGQWYKVVAGALIGFIPVSFTE